MEGKCVLFKASAMGRHTAVREIQGSGRCVRTVYLISSSWRREPGHLRPRFEIEEKLKALCDIPIFMTTSTVPLWLPPPP